MGASDPMGLGFAGMATGAADSVEHMLAKRELERQKALAESIAKRKLADDEANDLSTRTTQAGNLALGQRRATVDEQQVGIQQQDADTKKSAVTRLQGKEDAAEKTLAAKTARVLELVKIGAADTSTPAEARAAFMELEAIDPGGQFKDYAPPGLIQELRKRSAVLTLSADRKTLSPTRDAEGNPVMITANEDKIVETPQPLVPPAPTVLSDKDGNARAFERHNGAFTEIELPDGVRKTAPPVPHAAPKLTQTQQTEVGNYDAVLRESDEIMRDLHTTGLDVDNNALTTRGRSWIAQRLKVANNSPRVDKILQNVGYLQTVALRSAAGNQRLTNALMEVFKPHIGDTDTSGARLAEILPELRRQIGARRSTVYSLAGVDEPGAGQSRTTPSSAMDQAAAMIAKAKGTTTADPADAAAIAELTRRGKVVTPESIKQAKAIMAAGVK